MSPLFDTHCHIQSAGVDRGERMTQQLWAKAPGVSVNDILDRAEAAGVKQLICVGCDLEDSRLAIDTVQDQQGSYASIGIHPHESQHFAGQNGLLEAFAALVDRPKVVAVGECGLDYFYTHSPKDKQLEVLKFQMDLALSHDLPLIFHVREALDDFWPLFDAYRGKIRGVLHSFTDTAANLEKALDRGLYIGVNGIATFTKKDEQLTMYRSIPLEKLLLETDAPFLTPAPQRGTICEPYHIRLTANFLADLRGEDPEALAEATTSNATRLFRTD